MNDIKNKLIVVKGKREPLYVQEKRCKCKIAKKNWREDESYDTVKQMHGKIKSK